jgi:hypothetical protein
MKKFSIILAAIGLMSFLIYATGILWLPVEAKALLYVDSSSRDAYIKRHYDIHSAWDKCSTQFADRSAVETCFNKAIN